MMKKLFLFLIVSAMYNSISYADVLMDSEQLNIEHVALKAEYQRLSHEAQVKVQALQAIVNGLSVANDLSEDLSVHYTTQQMKDADSIRATCIEEARQSDMGVDDKVKACEIAFFKIANSELSRQLK